MYLKIRNDSTVAGWEFKGHWGRVVDPDDSAYEQDNPATMRMADDIVQWLRWRDVTAIDSINVVYCNVHDQADLTDT